MKFENKVLDIKAKIYNSRNLLMKFEEKRSNHHRIIYNSRNLLMKFEWFDSISYDENLQQ